MLKQSLPTSTNRAPTGPSNLTLLTFKVNDQVYGLPVTHVMRIIEMVTVTRLPGAPGIIQGIINLHGRAVPVMDLRQRFGLPLQGYSLHTPIILVDVGEGNRALGLIVDTVDQVLDAPGENLEMTEAIIPPELAGQMATEAGYLAGVAKVDRHLILVLNVRALLTLAEAVKLSQALRQTDEG